MKKLTTSQITILGLMVALLLVMAWTPLGYLNIGILAISFNVIPVAVSAIALGPLGGAIAGAVFGLTSFLQCIGIGGVSAMGAVLFGINPVLAFIQRFIPRLLDGFIIGLVFEAMRKRGVKIHLTSAVIGFLSAFLNTVLFMTFLVVLFGNTEYMQGLIGGRNILVFVCAYVGVNAVVEMAASTVITAAVGTALYRAHILPGKR